MIPAKLDKPFAKYNILLAKFNILLTKYIMRPANIFAIFSIALSRHMLISFFNKVQIVLISLDGKC